MRSLLSLGGNALDIDIHLRDVDKRVMIDPKIEKMDKIPLYGESESVTGKVKKGLN